MKLNVKKTEIFLLDVLLFEVIFTLKVVPNLQILQLTALKHSVLYSQLSNDVNVLGYYLKH